MLVNKCHECISNFLAPRNQVNTAIHFGSKTVFDTLINTVVFVVDVCKFNDGDSCLVFVLVEIFKEFTESITQEEKSVFVANTLEVLNARVGETLEALPELLV